MFAKTARLLLVFLIASPLGWIGVQIVASAGELHLGELWLDLLELTLWTLVYDGAAVALAALLAVPAMLATARASARQLPLILGLLLLAMLQPPVIYLYGWAQVLRLADIPFDPQSPADVARCIATLAMWLWPIPAAAVGLSLRQLDRDLFDAARIDGAQVRIVFRQILAPLAGSLAIALALALQQYSIFEQTNIAVVATEVQTVFSVGSLGGTPLLSPDSPPSQGVRAAAAAVTALPLVGLVLLLVLVAVVLLRRSGLTRAIEPSAPIASGAVPITVGTLCVTLGLPLGAMVCSLSRPPDLLEAVQAIWPQLTGSVQVSVLVAGCCTALGILAAVAPLRGVLITSLVCFFAGGQLLALGAIHLLNRPMLEGLYDSAGGVILVHTALFGWIPILMAGQFSAGAWQTVRLAAAVDGAGAWQYILHILLPASWRWHLIGGLCVFALSFGEIPAVMLLQPLEPQMLIPTLMTWVHLLRYDAMIEASLLLSMILVGVSVCLTGLMKWGR